MLIKKRIIVDNNRLAVERDLREIENELCKCRMSDEVYDEVIADLSKDFNDLKSELGNVKKLLKLIIEFLDVRLEYTESKTFLTKNDVKKVKKEKKAKKVKKSKK